jgi:hypothetical protein
MMRRRGGVLAGRPKDRAHVFLSAAIASAAATTGAEDEAAIMHRLDRLPLRSGPRAFVPADAFDVVGDCIGRPP